MNLLPGSGLPARTGKTQLEMYIVTGSTGPSRNCAFVQSHYTALEGGMQWLWKGRSIERPYVIKSGSWNGYRERPDAVRIAVLPFLRSRKRGGFL